jgi:3-oxoacyl-[acyl-carrier-protein] synthase II
MITASPDLAAANNVKSQCRVVVTGIGAVTPLGLTAEASWQSLLAGQSGIGPISRFDSSALPVHIAGEVKGFQPELFMDRKEVRRTSRASHLVVAAVRMALADARLPEPIPNPERVGTVVGTGAGGLEVVDRELTTLRTRGFDRVNPFALTGFLANMPAYHVSLITGAHGPINTVVAACASGSQAIADGVELIRRGRADVVVAAGVEGLIELTSIGAFARINALSTRNDDPEHACRPFDKGRDGTVLSEGAGALILESLEHAQQRNAPLYGELAGNASSSDAYHVTAPDPEAGGMVRAMQWALEDARDCAASGRLHQRARHGDAAKRQPGDAGNQARLWRGCLPYPGERQQGVDGARARRHRRHRGDLLFAGAARQHHPADVELRRARPGV